MCKLKVFCLALLMFIAVQAISPAAVRFEVEEEKPVGTFVADISQEKIPAQFRKGGFTNIVYEISNAFAQSHLQVDKVTGVIRTKTILDREKLALFDDILPVQVTVSADGSVSARMSVQVKILDVNDNTPSFHKKQEDLSISESAPLNSKFRIEVAEDPDLGSNSVEKYEIIKGNEEGFFALNVKRISPVNLVFLNLVNIKKLDRERNDSFELVIQASDKGSPPLSDTKILNISILDSNDHSPEFSKEFYTGEVKENLPEGTFVLNVSASDKDLGTNGEIRYYIDETSRHRDLFQIDSVTGDVRTKKVLDYELGQPGQPYRLTIAAKDRGLDSIPVVAVASIEVIDENDNTPVIKIELKSIFQSDGKLPEDTPLGSVIASVTVSDRDSGSNGEVDVELSRHRHDFALQRVFDNQYAIQVQRSLNLDMRAQYNLKIVARDRGSPKRKSNKSLTFELADSNRNAPKFDKSFYTIKVTDDIKAETVVETLEATDGDKGTNAQLSYHLIRLADWRNTSITNTGSWFTVDPLRGSLRLKTKLWCAFTPSFLITAEVRDHGRKPKQSRCTVNVTVTCSKHYYEFRVFEGAPPGTKVGDFGTDLRIPGKKLWIQLFQGRDSFLIVDNSTGKLTLAKELDREEKAFYLLKGLVTDGSIRSLIQLFIRVLDKNDNVPRFIGIDGQISVNIPTNARPGYRVWKVVAKDPDEGRNGKVTYSIINSNGVDAFTIDREQGHILIAKNLTKRSYVVTIRASDNGLKPRQRLVRMKVYLDDTLIVPTLPDFTTDSKVPAGVDARESGKGTFTNNELIIVIVLCTFCGVLMILLIAVVLVKYKRRAGANNRTSYHEAEISREDALKASKKMYKEATNNMYKDKEETNSMKSRNGRAPPLPKKTPPIKDPNWAKAEHESPSTSYMGSEYVGTDCETDSGREDVVQFSPYTTHIPAQKKAHDWRAGTFNSPHHAPPPYTPPRKHCDSPLSALARKQKDVRKPSLVKIPGVTHSATDL